MLLNLCICRILDLLIPLTNRVCDTGPDKVSPVYSAVFGGREECLEILLQNGYSPNAQTCLIFGFSSPMCMAFQKEYVYLLYLILFCYMVIYSQVTFFKVKFAISVSDKLLQISTKLVPLIDQLCREHLSRSY
jgi:hypothetical protein